jgi:acetyltransferase-like isoleucine patch superfamily enzyme
LEIHQPILIFGVGTLAQCAYSYFSDYSKQGIVRGLTVDKEYNNNLNCSEWMLSLPIINFTKEDIDKFWQDSNLSGKPRVFLAIGYNKRNRIREEKFKQCEAWGYDIVSFIHPSASIAHNAKLGRGLWIQEHCQIQNSVDIKDGYIGWAGCHVGHGSVVEEFVYQTTYSTICGNCIIGKNTFIGGNSIVFPRVMVGERNIIGALSLITQNTNNDDVYLEGRDNLKCLRSKT